ncbi:MAG: head GIN domain-containing protein [Crocinitomicaceae bacterium]
MKTLRAFLIPIGLLLILPSCSKIDASEGESSTKRFEVEDFDKIRIETAGVLNYTQSSVRNVEVSANDKIMKLIEIEVIENTLVISLSKNRVITNEENLIFTVSDDDVYSIETSGSANVNANFDEGHDFELLELISSGSGNIEMDAMNAENSFMTSSGSGDIHLQTVNVANKVSVNQNGSGNVSISGSCYELDLTISGSGNYGEHDFIAEKVVANLSGSGNAKVSVSYDLNASLSGSGNLTFKGNPILMATSTSGSGQVIDGN